MAVMADAPVPSRLSPALEVLFGRVHEAVLKLASAPEDQATLHNIGLVIGRVLDLLEEQAILAAADRLYEAASALQDIREAVPICSCDGASGREPSRSPASRAGRISGKPLVSQAECERTGTRAGVVNWNLLRYSRGEEQTKQGRSRSKNRMVQQGGAVVLGLRSTHFILPPKRADHTRALLGGARAEPCLTDAAPRGRSRHAVRR